MSNDIKLQIYKLEQEQNEMIKNIKEKYASQIEKLKRELKQTEQKEWQQTVNELKEVNISKEFNEWWCTWLRVYDKIYKDANDKYCYIDYNADNIGKIQQINIINSFDGNINDIVYYNNVEFGHDKRIIYCYINTKTKIKYVYYNKMWQKYN